VTAAKRDVRSSCMPIDFAPPAMPGALDSERVSGVWGLFGTTPDGRGRRRGKRLAVRLDDANHKERDMGDNSKKRLPITSDERSAPDGEGSHPRSDGASSWWPVMRQLGARDLLGLGASALSKRSATLRPRTERADRVVKSVCPYCAVGCGQLAFVENGRITDIEGDPDSPISQGCLCPKGAATFQLVTGSHRIQQVLYRRPRGTEWEAIPLETAMDMVAERVKKTRDAGWQEVIETGESVNRTLAIAHLGGATLDNEENYLIKKLWTALGIVQVENQARI
jgi:formate dehydrogenase major subunit